MTNSIAACQRRALQCLAQDSARLDGDILLSFVLNKPRTYLYAWPEKVLSEAQFEQFEDCLIQAMQGKPIAYITGKKEFWSLDLTVNPHTLIPRPDTECLVEAILADFSHHHTLTLLDAGTGSGAIALALKKEQKNWQIYASDQSYPVLLTAAQNSRQLALPVCFFQTSWLAAIADASLDVLVSNPPYIDKDDRHLAALSYEPISALVAGNGGLSDIEILCRQAIHKLKVGGRLYIEHGYQQAAEVAAIFQKNGFVEVSSKKDYAGNMRFTLGQKP